MLFEKRDKSWRSVVKIYFRSRVFVHATLKRANQLINIVKYVNQDKKHERNHDSRWFYTTLRFKYYFATDEPFLYYMLRVKYTEYNNVRKPWRDILVTSYNLFVTSYFL